MRRYGAGDLLCVAAGLSLVAGALLPWGEAADGRLYTALQMRLYAPLATALLTGGLLVAFGLRRTMWAALVAMASAFVATLLVLAIHTDVYQGLASVGVSTADSAHLTAFGVPVLFAAGLLAGLGGVVVAVQREEAVSTHADLPSHGAVASADTRT